MWQKGSNCSHLLLASNEWQKRTHRTLCGAEEKPWASHWTLLLLRWLTKMCLPSYYIFRWRNFFLQRWSCQQSQIVSTVLLCLEAPLQKLALSKHRNRSEIYILAETENFKELWHLALCADVLNPWYLMVNLHGLRLLCPYLSFCHPSFSSNVNSSSSQAWVRLISQLPVIIIIIIIITFIISLLLSLR